MVVQELAKMDVNLGVTAAVKLVVCGPAKRHALTIAPQHVRVHVQEDALKLVQTIAQLIVNQHVEEQ